MWQTYATLQITLGFVCLFFFFLNDLFVFLLIEYTTFFTSTHIIAYSVILMGVHWLVLVGFVPNPRPTWPNRVENFHTRCWLVRELVQSGQINMHWVAVGFLQTVNSGETAKNTPNPMRFLPNLVRFRRIWWDFAGFGEISTKFGEDLTRFGRNLGWSDEISPNNRWKMLRVVRFFGVLRLSWVNRVLEKRTHQPTRWSRFLKFETNLWPPNVLNWLWVDWFRQVGWVWRVGGHP